MLFIIQQLKLFALTVLLINITPGATFLAVSSNAITKGWKAGIQTALGASCGLICYVLVSWLGISAIIIHSPVIFNLLKWGGVLYLLYCAVKAFMQKSPDINAAVQKSKGENFRKGLFVNLLNPLTLVLFLGLIPQFVNDKEDVSSQVLFMGLWICASALLVNCMWSLLFGFLGKYLADKKIFWKWQAIVTGILFLLLAVKFSGILKVI